MRFRAHIPTQRKAAVCLRGKKKMREEEVDRGSQLAAAVLLAPFLSSWSACCSPPSLRAVLRPVHVPLLVFVSSIVAPLFRRCAAAASTRRWVARASVGLSPFLPLLFRGRHSTSPLPPLSFLSPLPARPWHRTTYPSRCDPSLPGVIQGVYTPKPELQLVRPRFFLSGRVRAELAKWIHVTN